MSGSIGKFSELPYYLSTEYFTSLIDSSKNTIQSSISSTIPLSGIGISFTDTESLSWEPSGVLNFTASYDEEESRSTGGCYLDGFKNTIYASGSVINTNVYAKIDGVGFKQLKITPASDSWISDNILTFKVVEPFRRIASTTVKRVTNSTAAQFITYEQGVDGSPVIPLENGNEIYLRKDSLLHSWYLSTIGATSELINDRKLYLYFGEIYATVEDPTVWNIIYKGLKDFAVAAFPENNMNDRLKEFLWVYFDKIYQSIYNLQKNVFSLIDPQEIDMKFLAYLAKQYDIDIDQLNITDVQLREFTQNAINFLKRKGSYASIYIIWRTMTRTPQDVLTIFDRWHEAKYTGSIPTSAWKDYEYTKMYDNFNDYPLMDGDVYPPQISSTSNSIIAAVSISTETATILHNLNTKYINVHCYDLSFKRIFPKNIIAINDNSVSITYENNFIGYVFIVGHDAYASVIDSNAFTFEHQLAQKNLFSTSYDINYNIIVPESVQLIDENNIITTSSENTLYGYTSLNKADYVHIQNELSSEWIIDHNLSYTGSIIEVYGTDGIQIYPNEIIIVSTNQCKVRFKHSIVGTAIAKRIGNPVPLSDIEQALQTVPPSGLKLSTHYRVEVNHSIRPLNNYSLMDEATMDSLMYGWELIRPATRVAHYSQVVYPVTDFSGRSIGLYKTAESASWKSKYVALGRSINGISMTTENYETTSMSILHNLNKKNVIVQCFDQNLKKVYPKEVICIDHRYCEVKFNDLFSGVVFICTPEYTASVDPSINWDITHSLNNQFNLIQTYMTTSEEDFMSMTISASDLNSLTLSNSTSAEGTIVLNSGDYLFSQGSSSLEWNITHSLGYIGAFIEVYDSTNKVIKPKEIELINISQIKITFETPQSGHVVLKAAGDPPIKKYGYAALLDENSYFKLGNGSDGTWDAKKEGNIQNEIFSSLVSDNVIEDDHYYYFTLTIPRNIEFNVTEIGLFNSDNNILFYTYGAPLFKHSQTSLTIYYKISKLNLV